jgi:hypothetical protein
MANIQNCVSIHAANNNTVNKVLIWRYSKCLTITTTLLAQNQNFITMPSIKNVDCHRWSYQTVLTANLHGPVDMGEWCIWSFRAKINNHHHERTIRCNCPFLNLPSIPGLPTFSSGVSQTEASVLVFIGCLQIVYSMLPIIWLFSSSFSDNIENWIFLCFLNDLAQTKEFSNSDCQTITFPRSDVIYKRSRSSTRDKWMSVVLFWYEGRTANGRSNALAVCSSDC